MIVEEHAICVPQQPCHPCQLSFFCQVTQKRRPACTGRPACRSFAILVAALIQGEPLDASLGFKLRQLAKTGELPITLAGGQ